MSQLSEILTAQKSLEECFSKRMGELEAQIQSSGPAKDTVAKVAEEFRAFRELVFKMLGLLRSQINQCSKMCDDLETRQQRKALIFTGIAEADKENCAEVVIGILNNKLGMRDITAASIKSAYRLGNSSKEHHRSILVRFQSVDHKEAVWRLKTRLKGTPIAVREFLTKARQSAFSKARIHFGMRSCWTQGGIIVIRCPDGSRCKITSIEELNPLCVKFPKVQAGPPSGAQSGTSHIGGAAKNASRKH